MTPDSACRPLTLADVEQAAHVIAQAFVDDPLCAFMLPFRRTRVGTLVKFFRAYGEVSVKNNRGVGVGEPLQGVAYWKFPDQQSLSVSVRTLGKFIPLLFTFYPLGYFRARAILNRIDALQAKYADGPYFYLDNIGVLPSARGQGLASRLIRPFLEKADAQGVIAYTDTVTRSNVALYEHFGFQCMEESVVAGVTVWALRRPIHSPYASILSGAAGAFFDFVRRSFTVAFRSDCALSAQPKVATPKGCARRAVEEPALSLSKGCGLCVR